MCHMVFYQNGPVKRWRQKRDKKTILLHKHFRKERQKTALHLFVYRSSTMKCVSCGIILGWICKKTGTKHTQDQYYTLFQKNDGKNRKLTYISCLTHFIICNRCRVVFLFSFCITFCKSCFVFFYSCIFAGPSVNIFNFYRNFLLLVSVCFFGGEKAQRITEKNNKSMMIMLSPPNLPHTSVQSVLKTLLTSIFPPYSHLSQKTFFISSTTLYI